MKSHYMQLDKILDIQKWQTLQDSLALATKLAILTVDYKGAPITRHSEPRVFCNRVRGISETERLCRRCDSRGGLEAARLNKPYIYMCHCNIVDIAIPIIVGDKYIGALMAGQVRLSKDEDCGLETILSVPTPMCLQSKECMEMYEEIPVMSYREIEIMSQMLFDVVHYIVSEAINRNLILEVMDYLRPLGAEEKSLSGYGEDSVRGVQKILKNAITSAQAAQRDDTMFLCKNLILKPAFEYIYNNRGEKLIQSKAAELCHISTGYFSRMFMKETGMAFSEFVTRDKLEAAKNMLETTDKSVAMISDELGFTESGYFIRMFKRYEGVTPLVYRSYQRERNKES